MNAISDVVQNRPLPLRDFDQIFMRAGDMVLQSEFVASWAKGKRLAFVGDGDAISICVAYLQAEAILEYGPAEVMVFDFDERIVRAVESFAAAKGISNLGASLYNCLDPVESVGAFDCFYTNPPWGGSNGGESINVFTQRGMELVGNRGEGLLVVADHHPSHPWTAEVLANVQAFASARGFYVSRMMPNLHSYHLDDDPELRSCNLILSARPANLPVQQSQRIDEPARLNNFYGRDGGPPTVRYVRATRDTDLRLAAEDEYELEPFGRTSDD